MKMRQTVKKAVALGTGALMLGATILGASAANLSDYPTAFVKDGKVTAKIVVGEKAQAIDVVGAIDIAADLQAAAVSKETVTTTGTGVVVSGGKTKEIALGADLSAFATLKHTSVPTFKDEKISWNDKEVDVDETMTINNVTIYTTSQDKDFAANPMLGTSAVGAIQYRATFTDDDLDLSLIGTGANEEVLKVEILGKSVEIQGVTSASTTDELTISIANEYYMAIGDSITVDGKKVKLVNVGSGNNVVVDVDGEVKTVDFDTGSEKINGLRVEVSDTFYVDATAERSATLKVGDKITDTVKDGDTMELFGEPSRSSDANWVWHIQGDPATSNTTLVIGADSNQVWDTDTEAVKKIGEKITLPNNYASVYMDSLTVKADTTLEMYFQQGIKVDLNETGGTTGIDTYDNQNALVIEASSSILKVNAGVDETSKVYLIATDDGNVTVAFDTDDDDIRIATGVTTVEAITVDFDDTDLVISYANVSSAAAVNITGDLSATAGMYFFLDADLNARTFGDDDTGYEAGDYSTSLASVNKDNDYLTTWGIVIAGLDDSLGSEEFKMTLPSEQVKVNVVAVGNSGSTSASSGSVTTDKVNPIGVDFGVLDKDFTAGSANSIVVGGPCVNTFAAKLSGNTADCAEGFAEGEAKLAMFDDGSKIALLVAGYTGADTLSATRALVSATSLPAKTSAKVVTTNVKNPSIQ